MSKSCVHLIQKSPFASDAMDACLRVCHESDVIILMSDAVYAASLSRMWPTKRVYALAEDLASRGISDSVDAAISSIDYMEMVELCSQHQHSQSWF